MTRRISFDTSVHPAGDRVASWLDTLAAVCGRLYADPLDARTLDARMVFGEVGRIRIGQIEASRHRIGLTEALARHEPHAVAKMIVQTAGTSVYEQGGAQIALAPGECLIYDVSQPHMITTGEASEHLVVIIPHDLVAARGVRLDNLHAQRFSATTGVGRLSASLIATTLDQLDAIAPGCEADLAAAILNLVFSPLVQTARHRDTLRYRIKAYVRAHARDPELSLDAIARAFRCSKRTLHLAFEDCDLTIADFLRATRLDGCKAEIEHRPDRSISEIAYAWGFASPAHFSRLFHQRFGTSPSSLRRGMT